MSAIKKYLIKKLAAKAGYSPEELPMSISDDALNKRLPSIQLPGGPFPIGQMPRLTRFDLEPTPPSVRTIESKKEPKGFLYRPEAKGFLPKNTIAVRKNDKGDVQIITKDMVELTSSGQPKRNKSGEFIFKTPEKQKTKTKPKATRSPEENRILQEKILDKILENPLATIKRQRVESNDDVIDISSGMPIEEARELLADVPAEITSGKTIVGRVGKLSPTTIGRSKAVDLKSAKAKELVRLMNKLEEAELKGTDTEEITKIRKQLGLMPAPRKDIEFTLEEKINRITNKEDREALRKIFATKKIAEGQPVKVRPTSKKRRIVKYDDPSKITALTKARTARDPDKEFTVLRTVDRESNYPDDLDLDPFTVTKGTTSRDPAKGLDEESQLPNIVGQASDPKSPVTKLDIQADPGFARKTDQEFFDNRVQDYLDQGDDLKTSRARARNDLGERKLSEEYTGDQLRDLLGEGVLETDLGEIADSEATKMLERAFEEGLTKKKTGGQVGKPKRKIKKSVRGNDLVAMMYD